MSLSVSVDYVAACTVVQVDGELDHATAPVLGATLDRQIGAGRDQVIVDLTRLTFLDSSGLRVLVSRDRQLRRRKTSLRLVGPSAWVRKLLGITGLDLVFDIHDTVQTALDWSR